MPGKLLGLNQNRTDPVIHHLTEQTIVNCRDKQFKITDELQFNDQMICSDKDYSHCDRSGIASVQTVNCIHQTKIPTPSIEWEFETGLITALPDSQAQRSYVIPEIS